MTPAASDLNGRAFLVTGAASGIGRATALRLVADGGRVALVDRDEARLADVAAELSGPPGAMAIPCDVSDAEQVRSAVRAAHDRLGHLHGVVTSAGIFDEADMAPLGNLDIAAFDRVIGVNLRGTVLVLDAVLPLMSRGDAAVLIASTAGLRGHGFGAAYTASKGGIVALTRLVATQQGPNGVRVNCVCPGATAGEGMGAAFNDEDFARSMSRDVPLRRVGAAAEIGDTIVALLNDDMSYVTGQIIAVDGGATIR